MKLYRYGLYVLLLTSLSVLSASIYFQVVMGLRPCPLCLMQRYCVLLVVITSWGALIGRVSRARKLLIAQALIALAGLYFSGRQVWLQSLTPDQLPACLPGLDVLIKYFPWQDVLKALVLGSSECSEVTWQWLGLSMPAWSALYFLGLFLGTLVVRYIIRRL